jgi:hypothetical protein
MMIGLYLSWMIVLYGAEVAHASATRSKAILLRTSPVDGRVEVARVATMDFSRATAAPREEPGERLPSGLLGGPALDLLRRPFLRCGPEMARRRIRPGTCREAAGTIRVMDILTAVREAADPRYPASPRPIVCCSRARGTPT